MADRTHAMLDLAHGWGIGSFDAARSYGYAERFLSDWLSRQGVEPGDVAVSSKWGYVYVGDWKLQAPRHEVKHHDLATFERQWEASRKLLWSHLDLYQVHSLTADSPFFSDPALQEALAERKEVFGVRLGFTTTGPKQADTIRKAAEIEISGGRLFDTVQATFNLWERSAGAALTEARRAGLGVLVKEALANGRLTAPESEAQDPWLTEGVRLAKDRNVTLDALCLRFVLDQPFADTVLTGAVTKTQLRQNVAATVLPWDEHLAAWADHPPKDPTVYWEERSRLAWN